MTRILLIAGIHTTSTLISNSLLLRVAAKRASRARRRAGTIPRWRSRNSSVQRPSSGSAGRPSGTTAPSTPWSRQATVDPARGSANRDERKFNPEALNLVRSPVYHMAFGQGIHHCIGAPLARMESRIAFEEFFTRVSDYEIVGPVTRLFTRQEQRGIASLPARLA